MMTKTEKGRKNYSAAVTSRAEIEREYSVAVE